MDAKERSLHPEQMVPSCFFKDDEGLTMMKYLLWMLSALWAVNGSAHDAPYYYLHPKQLQTAILGCHVQQSQGITCEEFNQIASKVNQ